jgi:hypothetical protein
MLGFCGSVGLKGISIFEGGDVDNFEASLQTEQRNGTINFSAALTETSQNPNVDPSSRKIIDAVSSSEEIAIYLPQGSSGTSLPNEINDKGSV